MAARTIPEPHPDDFKVAFQAGLLRAESVGLKPATEEPVRALLEAQAEVHAQMAAEIRWLRNIIHNPNRGTQETD